MTRRVGGSWPTGFRAWCAELVEGGWQVFAEGRAFRQAGQFSVSVSSGVDWFELQGAAAFGETMVPLPQLLAALRRGESMVTLDDGSYGLLPEEWLRRLGVVAGNGRNARRFHSLSAEPGGRAGRAAGDDAGGGLR